MDAKADVSSPCAFVKTYCGVTTWEEVNEFFLRPFQREGKLTGTPYEECNLIASVSAKHPSFETKGYYDMLHEGEIDIFFTQTGTKQNGEKWQVLMWHLLRYIDGEWQTIAHSLIPDEDHPDPDSLAIPEIPPVQRQLEIQTRHRREALGLSVDDLPPSLVSDAAAASPLYTPSGFIQDSCGAGPSAIHPESVCVVVSVAPLAGKEAGYTEHLSERTGADHFEGDDMEVRYDVYGPTDTHREHPERHARVLRYGDDGWRGVGREVQLDAE